MVIGLYRACVYGCRWEETKLSNSPLSMDPVWVNHLKFNSIQFLLSARCNRVLRHPAPRALVSAFGSQLYFLYKLEPKICCRAFDCNGHWISERAFTRKRGSPDAAADHPDLQPARQFRDFALFQIFRAFEPCSPRIFRAVGNLTFDPWFQYFVAAGNLLFYIPDHELHPGCVSRHYPSGKTCGDVRPVHCLFSSPHGRTDRAGEATASPIPYCARA